MLARTGFAELSGVLLAALFPLDADASCPVLDRLSVPEVSGACTHRSAHA